MSNSLSSDLASLKIDRDTAPRSRGSSFWVWVSVLGLGAGVGLYVIAAWFVENWLSKTEVALGQVFMASPAQAQVELSSSGYVVPQHRTQVGARMTGRVSKVHVREGERVRAGQVLLELDRADQRAAISRAKKHVATARARVASARASLEEVKGQLARDRALAASGAAPRARVEELELRAATLAEQVKAAQADVVAADSDVEVAEVNLAHMTLSAPISGTIANKPPELGEVLGNDFGVGTSATGKVEIVDLTSLMIETDVPEGHLQQVQVGSPCEIVLDAFPSERYRGETAAIMPKVDRSKATVVVKVKFWDTTDKALPDMAARVSFLARALEHKELAAKPKLIVPAAAVTERAGNKVVFVVEDARVRMLPVTLGPVVPGGFELLLGPAQGAQVVMSPPQMLANGQMIKARSAL